MRYGKLRNAKKRERGGEDSEDIVVRMFGGLKRFEAGR